MHAKLSAITALALLLLAQQAHSEDADDIHPILDDQFTFRLGALINEADASLTATRIFLPVTEIDLDTLGIDNTETTGWMSFRWRFKPRWAVNFIYNGYQVNGRKIVTDEFNYDGVTYPVGAGLDTTLKADGYVVDLSYSFWTGKKHEVGAGLGLHAFDLETEINTALLAADSVVSREVNRSSLIAPVPNLRLFARYAITNRTALDFNTGWLSMNYQEWDGRYLYLAAKLEYRLRNNVGAGIGYQYTDIDVTNDKGPGRENLWHVTFDSLSVYLTYSF